MAPTIWDESLTSHKQRQREHILRAAAQLVSERGAADIAMSVLARRAGVARATLYNYFPDVERVLSALVADQAARFRTELDRQLAEATDPSGRLHRYLLAVHQWGAQRRHARAGGTDRSRKLSPQLLAVIHEPLTDLRELLCAILTDGVARGSFGSDIDPKLYAEFILRLLLDSTATGPAALDQLLRFIQRGLTATARPSGAAGAPG